jgi:hypothetical protein
MLQSPVLGFYTRVIVSTHIANEFFILESFASSIATFLRESVSSSARIPGTRSCAFHCFILFIRVHLEKQVVPVLVAIVATSE